jgi:hypothetical protein
VIAFTPARNKLKNHFRRILQISVNDNYRITASAFESSGYSNLMPKISGEPQHSYVWIALLYLSKKRLRFIEATVVDEDQFVTKWIQGQTNTGQTIIGCLEYQLFVVTGYDDGK